MVKRTAAGTLALAVCLSGGALALAGAANADSQFSFGSAIAGDTRYDTAIAAAQAQFPKGADSAVVVNAHSTVDGLTASYIAGLHNAPILYTDAASTPAKTAAELKTLGVKNVYVVGGTTVVSSDQTSAWTAAGLSVTRYGGASRYETAALAADAGGAQKTAFVASGDEAHLADALAVGPIAYKAHTPILLTQAASTPAVTTAEITKLGAKAIVVGGTAVVPDAQVASLGGARLSGATRSDTAAAVADWAIANAGFSKTSVALVGAANANAADALVAAPVAGSNSVPVLFAGTDPTNAYLKTHAADLTGHGFVFGGVNAVSASAIASATSAAQSIAVASSFVVIAHSGTSATFSYADPSAKKAVSATALSTDKFTIDGSPATFSAFTSAITLGDTISMVAPSTTGGATTYNLTNVTVLSGLVGSFGSGNVNIIDPVTGATLTSISDAPTSAAYTVNGTTVSKANFEAAINPGDNIAISGTGADSSHVRTFALTSGSVAGLIATPPGSTINSISAGTFNVQTSAGAIFTITASSISTSDTFSIDGASVTSAVWLASTALSVGDQFSYSKVGGIQHFSLVNTAPASVTGLVKASGTSAGTVAWYTAAGASGSYAYGAASPQPTYKIDGVVGSASDFATAAIPGAWVTYQAADTGTSTLATLSVTSKPLSGTVSAADSSAKTISVADSNGNTLDSGLDYTSTTSLFSTGTSLVYTVDGTTSTVAQFSTAINKIQTGARTGTIVVSNSSGVVTYALSTAVNTNAPAAASIVATTGSTAATLSFNKPISSSSTLGASDFTITKSGSWSAPTVASATVNGSGQIAIVWASAFPSTSTGDTLTVALTAAGAAKLSDGRGVAVATGSSATQTF